MLYFLQAKSSKLVKIGHAKQVRKRVNNIQVASPEPLELLGVCEGGPDDEARLHQKWAKSRVNGEWFRPVKSLMNFIESNTSLPSKRPPGRPPLSDARKSDRPLRIRLTDRERKTLDKAARKTGKPTATWARDLLIEAANTA